MVGGGTTPSTWNFGSKRPRWTEIADFEPIIVRSASALTTSEKSLINTNRKSTTRFPMSLRWSSYVAPKPQQAAITPKRHEIWCQLVLITNRKSHTDFPLVPTSMTLNDLERCNSPYFAFLPNSISLQADCITVVEDRPIMLVKYCLPVPVFHFWPKLTHPAARSLCDIWASHFF